MGKREAVLFSICKPGFDRPNQNAKINMNIFAGDGTIFDLYKSIKAQQALKMLVSIIKRKWRVWNLKKLIPYDRWIFYNVLISMSLQSLLLFHLVGGRFAETTMCRAEIIQANFLTVFIFQKYLFQKQ